MFAAGALQSVLIGRKQETPNARRQGFLRYIQAFRKNA